MEDVLEVYHRPYDERRPLVCLDEVPVQLVGEARVPLPPRPGKPARFDYEYVRNGTANLFIQSFPDERPLGPRLRLERVRLPTRKNGCNDFPQKSAAGSRPLAT
jgi:hypothetical protein